MTEAPSFLLLNDIPISNVGQDEEEKSHFPQVRFPPKMENRTALIEWPGNDYITSSLRRAFAAVLPGWSLCESAKELEGRNADLQFSDYDLLDWDAGMKSGNLVSSYVIRKASVPLHSHHFSE